MSISDWSSDVCSSDLFARVRRTERIAPIGEHMGRMLAPLALQHGQRDLVERNAERAAVLRVAMPDRGHAAGHIDPVPCQTENVALPPPRRPGEQHPGSEARRVGKEGFSAFTYRWSPYP